MTDDNSNKSNSSGQSEDSDAFEIASVGGEPATPASSAKHEEKILKLEEDLKRAKSDYLYLRADFDNYKRSVIKERSELIKYGSERVFTELLNVLDTFERALLMDLTTESLAQFKEGIQLTANELKKSLENFGLKEVPSMGVAFDPNVHEALSSEPTDSVPPGHITQVFKKPYKLHDRIIRHGQVVVAKAPEKQE